MERRGQSPGLTRSATSHHTTKPGVAIAARGDPPKSASTKSEARSSSWCPSLQNQTAERLIGIRQLDERRSTTSARTNHASPVRLYRDQN